MIERTLWSEDDIDGAPVMGLTLSNRNGVRLGLLSYGARVTELWAPDRNGSLADIALGFEDLASYQGVGGSFGATCGPVGNRISGASFTLDGETHHLVANEGPNTRHGGPGGYSRRNWETEIDPTLNRALFRYRAEDGEEGFPGPMVSEVLYKLDEDDRIIIEMTASAARPTVVNLIHHSYFNLAGHGAGDILGHEARLPASHYTPLSLAKLPTGEVLSVAETPFDFREAKPIGRDLAALAPLTGQPDGYDHNWCVDGAPGALRLAAELYEPGSGRRMRVESDQPGVQLYAGGGLGSGIEAKGGAVYGPYSGVALETQRLPDSPNIAHFPSAVLRPGETYKHRMQISLSAD